MSANDPVHEPNDLMQPSSTTSKNSDVQQLDSPQSSLNPPLRSLKYQELVYICEALGGQPGLTAPSSTSTETSSPPSVDEKHASSKARADDEERQIKSIPKIRTDTPRGLYKKVIDAKNQSYRRFLGVAYLYNAFLVLQIIFGAALTALGASDNRTRDAITLLAAANTINAGLIALLHNSGVPTRYRNDWDEWCKVETYMTDIMDSGVVYANMTKEDVIATCQAMYIAAFATVENNKPLSYIPTVATAVMGGRAAGITKVPPAVIAKKA